MDQFQFRVSREAGWAQIDGDSLKRKVTHDFTKLIRSDQTAINMIKKELRSQRIVCSVFVVVADSY